MKERKLNKYHLNFIISLLTSMYMLCYGIFFLYRKSVYYNYIFLLLLGFFLGFQLSRKLFDKSSSKEV